MIKSTLGSLLLIAALLLSSCTVVLPMAEEFLVPTEQPDVVEMEPEEQITPVANTELPVGLAISNEQIGALATAILQAGFLDILLTDGPFTILAPTDEAFDALGELMVASLAEDDELLAEFIEYHVIEGQYMLADLREMDAIENMAGVTLTITLEDPALFIEDARVVASDIVVPNAVVHVIDRLLYPVDEMTLDSLVDEDISLETLLTLMQITGMDSLLRGPGPYTLLAPTNEAFERYFDEEPVSLDDTEALTALLQYHVIPERVVLTDTVESLSYETLLGPELTFEVDEDMAQVDGATVLLANIVARNGMLHIIDEVLVPPEDIAPAETPEAMTLSDLQDGLVALERVFGAEILIEQLTEVDEFTLFVPTEAALEGLSDEALDMLDQDQEALRRLLQHHIVTEILLAADFATLTETTTLAELTVRLQTDPLAVDGVPVVFGDFIVHRGIVHLIDGVLMTPELEMLKDPMIEITPTPDPEVDVTPTPEIEIITPTPEEVTPTPTPEEVTPTPTPEEVTPTPEEVTPTPTPDLDVTPIPTPDPEITPTPDVEVAPAPLLSREFSLVGMLRAMVVSGLLEELEEVGPFTLFGPSDTAVNKLPPEKALQMAHDPDALRMLLEMHIVPGTYLGDDLAPGSLETLRGEDLTLTLDPRDGRLMVNGARILWVDMRIGDVVIHIIDEVLLPPEMIQPMPEITPTPDLELTPTPDVAPTPDATPTPDLEVTPIPTPEIEVTPTPEVEVQPTPVPDVGSLAEVLQQDPRVDLFASLFHLASEKGMLEADGPLTLLAPTDAVMRNVPNAMLLSFIRRDAVLTELLNHHIISGNLRPRDLADLTSVTTLAGHQLEVSVENDIVQFGDATVIDQLAAENGTLYLIDEMLLYPDIPLDIIGRLYVEGEYTHLLRLLEISGVANTLSRGENLTLLAPNDTAFGELTLAQMENLTADPEALAQWLERHIIPRTMTDQNLSTVTAIRTVADETLTVRARNGRLFIGGMRVVDPNIRADNGIIHGMDTVVLPRP